MRKSIFALILCAVALCFPMSSFVWAEKVEKGEVTYLAFGDSIAEGTVLTQSGNDGNENLQLKEDLDGSNYYTINRHPDLLKTKLEEKYETVNYTNLADASDKLADFVTVVNNTDSSLLASADFVTLCIGANDILGPGLDALPKEITSEVISELLAGATSFDEAVLSSTIQTNLTNKITTAMQTGATAFQNSYETQLRAFLDKLNQDANVYIMSVYNPYKNVEVKFSFSYLSFNLSVSLDLDSITMPYLENNADSVNNTIKSAIENINNPNVKFVDLFTALDGYSGDYKDLILVKDEARNSQTSPLSDLSSINYLLDPHPTDLGHEKIAEVYWAQMEADCKEPTVEPEPYELNITLNGTQLTAKTSSNLQEIARGQSYEFVTTEDVIWTLYNFQDTILTQTSAPIATLTYDLEAGQSYKITAQTQDELGTGTYFFKIEDEPDVPVEPEAPVVKINGTTLSSGSTLENQKVDEIIAITIDKAVYYKVFNAEQNLVDGLLGQAQFNSSSNKYEISFELASQGNYTLKLYSDDAYSQEIFNLGINVTSSTPIDPTPEQKENPKELYLKLFESSDDMTYTEVLGTNGNYFFEFDVTKSYVLKLCDRDGNIITVSDYDIDKSITFYYVKTGTNLQYVKIDTLNIVEDTTTGQNKGVFEIGRNELNDEISLNITGQLLIIGEYKFFAVLEGESVSYNLCNINLTTPASLKISKIEMNETRGNAGELSSYTFAVVLSDTDITVMGLDIIWKIDGVVVGYGGSIVYTPDEQGAHTVSATIVINGVEQETSRYETSFHASQNNTILIIIGVGVFVVILALSLVVTIVVKIKKERIW